MTTVDIFAAGRAGLRQKPVRGALPARAALIAITALAFAAGFVLTAPDAARQAEAAAGPDLARLLKAMALIKLAFILPALGAISWRLGAPLSAVMLAAYLAAAMAMSLSLGLIWDLVHVGWGAMLMHAGLFAAILLLLRDKGVAAMLQRRLSLRRSLRQGQSTDAI